MTSEYGIINDNITVIEVEGAIDYLKNNKSPGVDGIPFKFIKICKSNLSSYNRAARLSKNMGRRVTFHGV